MTIPLDTPSRPRKKGEWGFLTNHAHVLLCVAHDPGIRLRDIAVAVGLTERGTHKVLSQLVEAGYVRSERLGRRNRYEVRLELSLRHPLVQKRAIGDLLEVLLEPRPGDTERNAADGTTTATGRSGGPSASTPSA